MNPLSNAPAAAIPAAIPTNVAVGVAPGDEFLQDAEELIIENEGDLLRVRGDVDLYVTPQFQERALAHIRAVAQPRLDLNGVAFMDSAGLAALVSLVREAQASGKVLRVSVSGSPRRVLRITGIDQMMVLDE